MKLLFQLFERRTFAVCAVVGVLIIGLEYLGIGLILPLLHYTMNAELAAETARLAALREALGLDTHERFVIVATGVFAAFFLLKSVVLFLLQRWQMFLLNLAHQRLAVRIMGRILEADYRVFIERSPSSFVTTLQMHTSYAVLCLTSFVMMAVEAALLVLLLLLALWLNWVATLILMGALLLLGLGLKFVVLDRMHALGRERNRAGVLWHHLCYGVVSAIRDIKIMRLEPQLQTEFHQIAGEYSVANARYMALQSVPKLVGETCFVLGIIAVIAVFQVTRFELAANAAVLTTFVVVLTRMVPSVHKLYNSASQYKYCYQDMATLAETADYLQTRRLPVTAETLPFEREIALEGVSYRYAGAERPALDAVSLTLRKGRFIGVVGRSGSGKSTFLDVLVGLLQADGGRILLDGREVDPFSSDVIRRHIGYVPQQVTLLDESLGYNISLDPDWAAHPERVRAAAAAARIAEFIEAQPEGYAAPAGERGVKMSGGQRQRIGIARALYTRPEILLLDEATSAVDAITEAEIMTAVVALAGRQTVIFATHRLPAIRACDEIIVFDQGRVAGIGTHDALLRTCPPYQLLIQREQENNA